MRSVFAWTSLATFFDRSFTRPVHDHGVGRIRLVVFIVSIEAPFPSSSSTVPVWPRKTARCNGVLLGVSIASIEAPFAGGSSTTLVLLPAAEDADAMEYCWIYS